MYIAYFDETGDDGFPKYSSELFVLTSLYFHHQYWKDLYNSLRKMRESLRTKYSIPITTELHTKNLLLSKEPYVQFQFSESQRIQIVMDIAKVISMLRIKSINVAIQKTKINIDHPGMYQNILDAALNFNIQRIENCLLKIDPTSKFLIITDEGRVPSMRRTTRKIQKVNFIPSKFSTHSYRKEIKLLIEDPLPKDSKEGGYLVN